MARRSTRSSASAASRRSVSRSIADRSRLRLSAYYPEFRGPGSTAAARQDRLKPGLGHLADKIPVRRKRARQPAGTSRLSFGGVSRLRIRTPTEAGTIVAGRTTDQGGTAGRKCRASLDRSLSGADQNPPVAACAGGGVLLREVGLRPGLLAQMAGCFPDNLTSACVEQSVRSSVATNGRIAVASYTRTGDAADLRVGTEAQGPQRPRGAAVECAAGHGGLDGVTASACPGLGECRCTARYPEICLARSWEPKLFQPCAFLRRRQHDVKREGSPC